MKRHSTPIVVFAFVAMAILPLAQGCKKKPPTTTAEARPPVEAPQPPEQRVPPPPAAAPRDVEVGDVMASDIADLNTKGYLKDAYFDYDQSDLRDDARSALSGNAEWLKRYPRARRPPRQRRSGLPRLARRRRVSDPHGLLRQGAAGLHGVHRGLLAAESPRALRDHRQVA
jgi:hypothetical protein